MTAFSLLAGVSLHTGCQQAMHARKPSTLPNQAYASPKPGGSEGIYPVSRLPSSSSMGIPGPAASQHQPTTCNGPCCRTASYEPTFPEFATTYQTSNTVPQGVQPATFQDFGMMGCGVSNCYAPNLSDGCSPALPRFVDPNEYVYDGGDRDPEARLRNDLSIVGLDSEDTVIRYETQDGTMELQSGCRVPIYAPRFATTRKIRTLGYQEHVVGAHAALRQQSPGRMTDVLPPNHVRLKETPVRDENVAVIEAYRDRKRGLNFEKVLPAIDISDAFKPYEDLAIIRYGKLTVEDRIKLQRFAMAAMAWTSIENLHVFVDNQTAQLVQESLRPEETLVYELDGKPRVRLCKVASHQVAEAGDIIDFTIRFDNVGDHTISNIAVHDSLSPRLEYVEDSQKSSLKADFVAQANDAGSSELKWTIQETVKPGQGGFIRFQCKVR